MNKRVRRLPTVYLYPEEDGDLIAWLDSLGREVNKSRLVKELLRRGLQSGASSSNPTTSISLDADAVREAVAAAIAQSLDLVEIRRVVEAGVASALASARVSVVEEASDEGEDDSEAFLDTLGEELLM